MADDELTYEDVIDVWEREKDSKQPCSLPNNFYERLRRYIQDLEREIEEIDVPPKNKREKRTQKQYQRVKKIADLFFKERQKKIVLAAYHRSLDETVKTENLTEPELELLEDISKLIKELKNEIFLGEYKRSAEESHPEEEMEIEKGKESEDIDIQQEQIAEESFEEREVEKSDLSEQKSSEERAPSDKEKARKTEPEGEKAISEVGKGTVAEEVESQEEVLVHITEDVPPFVDMDTTYDLKKEDVLTLREDIAEVLIEREKARKIKI